MRTMRQKQRVTTAKCVKRAPRRFSVKSGGKSRSDKNKLPVTDWQHLSKEDINIILRVMKNPPPRSRATEEARALYLSIPQIGSDS